MNKVDLEVKIESLKNMVLESQQSTSNYTGQLVEMEKQLADLDKPKVTSLFLDTLNEVITEAVEGLELDDGVTCDLEIDYDNRVTMSDFRFEDAHAVSDKIYCAVEKLFAEIREKEDK
jgi:hypothetical protein|tara:strand:+ start:166 stop:519 length:354 start_codon:yes stop_codon:yes gene_type:complete